MNKNDDRSAAYAGDLETQRALASLSRRNGIKNVIIVFLVIVLVLTFFSNTILNYTLPQVATQYVQAGEISPRVKGSGTAVVEDPYNVSIASGRKIADAVAHTGDEVKKGDVLYVLEETQSDGLKTAKKELESVEASFQKALFSGTLTDYAINRIRKGDFLSEEEMQSQVSTANSNYNKAVANDNAAAEEVAKYESSGGSKYTKAQEKKAKTAAQLTKATTDRDAVISGVQAEIDMKALYDALQEAEDKVEQLEKQEKETEITAPVDGTVTSMAYQAGDTVAADTPAAVIRREGKSMTVSFTVTREQAQGLRVGDEAKPQNAWAYGDFSAKLLTIAPDPTDPGASKILTFQVECADIEPGEQVALSVGQSAKQYDLTVPSSAVREDNNGKFVLIVTSRTSPLGNRYTASRVDVQVLAKDDRMSAISGNLTGYEYVITTSTRPISPGMQVRLSDDAEL